MLLHSVLLMQEVHVSVWVMNRIKNKEKNNNTHYSKLLLNLQKLWYEFFLSSRAEVSRLRDLALGHGSKVTGLLPLEDDYTVLKCHAPINEWCSAISLNNRLKNWVFLLAVKSSRINEILHIFFGAGMVLRLHNRPENVGFNLWEEWFIPSSKCTIGSYAQ